MAKKIILDDDDRAFIEALRAGLAADDGADHAWVDELPQDPGVPTRSGEVVSEVRATRPSPQGSPPLMPTRPAASCASVIVVIGVLREGVADCPDAPAPDRQLARQHLPDARRVGEQRSPR